MPDLYKSNAINIFYNSNSNDKLNKIMVIV